MVNVKQTSAAGIFYPRSAEELNEMIEKFGEFDANCSSRAVIIPHAGYKYSGELAYKGFHFLNKDIKNIFVIAPAHYERIYGCAVCDYDEWQTPFGNIEINSKLSKEIANFCDCSVNNFAFEKEHSVEVQMPFIKKMFPQAKVIPLLYGCENFANLAQTITHFWQNKDNGFVISSDLSHFYPERESAKIDLHTARMIEDLDTRDFDMEQACGAVGICGLIDFAKENNFSLIRAGITNSAAATGDSSRVVGYGSWFLYEGEKNDYLKKYYTDFILKVCKDSIMSGLQLGDCEPDEYDCVFEEYGASFVTLKLDGELRGCIGSIISHRPLIKDLIRNAHSAAFSDPRFQPLNLLDFNKIKISVSLLSKPSRMEFKNEEDLLAQLKVNKDGLIIRDGNNQAVFLPVIWEELQDKKEFLNHLKLKAGFSEDYFSETMEAFKFYATKID